MISVVLSILKFILIILACIIGLVILIICLVLFVPIRYEVSGKLDDNIIAKGRVSWLLRILSLRISYVEEILKFKITVFGISILDSEQDEGKNDNQIDTLREDVAKKGTLTKFRKSKKVKKDTTKKQYKTGQKREEEQKELDEKVQEPIIEKFQDTFTKSHESEDKDKLKQDDDKDLKKRLEKALEEKPKKKGKRSIRTVIEEAIESIKDLIIKILKAIISILINIYNFLLQIESEEEPSASKFTTIKLFLKENKPGIKVALLAVKDLLNHIKPRKFEGNVEFGTDNPSSTGKILGLVSIFHGSYYRSLRITPNFEERILKGQIFLKGRIRLFTILIIVVKLILNKSFQNLWNNYKILKEEL